ncbi:beta-glucuronidase [Microbacterium sp.]|jgi:beta-glucuronidase|uniref:beta-glucuronidase n=1 Tax=Microbacterium sp. TaxID=51671 RepID=UPI0037C85CB2
MLKPIATATREANKLDGLWRFAIGDGSAQDARWWTSRLPGLREVPVPASYNDLFMDTAVASHVGWVYYQRRLRVPESWTDSAIILRMDAATHEASVYVGDELVGSHVGGYTPFEVDITAHANAGTEVRVTIAVNNELTRASIPPGEVVTGPDGRRRQTFQHDFANYAGLNRPVWLLRVPRDRVRDVTVTTRSIGPRAIVDYDVVVDDAAADVVVNVRDADDRVVATGEGARGSVVVEHPHLWAPGDGYLYRLDVEARNGDGDIVDVYEQPFGIRTVAVRGTQFLINDVPFSFTGFGKHEDAPVRGRGHDDAFMVHDFELMRWIGANSFRTSHYPYAEDVIDYADRHGIVVVDETAAVGLNMAVGGGVFGQRSRPTFGPDGYGDATRTSHENAIEELIARDKNHPSVVMWSLANEPDSGVDGAREYSEPLVELARRLDPSRPITYSNVALASHETDRLADLFDVLCLNRYYCWYVFTGDLAAAEVRLEKDLTAWAAAYDKPIVMAEYGADSIAGMHSATNEPWSEEYQADLLRMYHRVFDRIPSIVGEHVWNFADFATGPSTHRVGGNKKGVFTRDRKPKAAAFALRDRWAASGGDATP